MYVRQERDLPVYISVADLAELMDKTENAVRCMMRRGEFPDELMCRLGRRVMFLNAETRAWLKEKKARKRGAHGL